MRCCLSWNLSCSRDADSVPPQETKIYPAYPLTCGISLARVRQPSFSRWSLSGVIDDVENENTFG